MICMVSLLRVLSVLLFLGLQSGHTVAKQGGLASFRQQISEVLTYVLPANRSKFYSTCIGTIFKCSTGSFSPGFFQWRAGITTEEQKRFWQSYRCISKLDRGLCPVDGEWSVWTAWTNCSAPCEDVGNRTRTRLCNNPLPVNRGRLCIGVTLNVETCMGNCYKDDVMNGYRESEEHLSVVHKSFPRLTVECLQGHCDYQHVTRILTKSISDRYWSHLMCFKYRRACPVDGMWTEWGQWSECSVLCGNGFLYRHRACANPLPRNGGRPCPGLALEQQPCVSKKCSHITGNERAVFTEWSDFSQCSISCGKYGFQVSKRTCLLEHNCVVNNDVIETLTLTRPCYRGPCPVSGGWSEWSDWTECSAISGNGRRTRVHMCSKPSPSGGAFCVGPQLESSSCTENGTSVRLSGPKEEAKQKLNLKQVTIPTGDPYNTAYDTSKEHWYSTWSTWSKCSQSCGGGYRWRVRDCNTTDEHHFTHLCDGEIQQIQFCNAFPCPEPGGWGEWTAWSACPVTCSNGFRRRFRRCDNPYPAHGGSCFGVSQNFQACNAGRCINDIHNHWSEWTSWSACSKSCGGGEKIRKRNWMGRDKKDNEIMTGFCNPSICDEPGNWAMWGQWSACSSTCNLGYHFRDRTCTDPAPVSNGETCPGPGSETAYCYEGPCKGDEPAIVLNGQSYLTYSSHVKHMHYLLVYMRLRPMSFGGALFYRYRGCKEGTWDCKHAISLILNDEWKLQLKIFMDEEELEVTAKDKLTKNTWNDIQVGISRHAAYIRVNDGDHTVKEFLHSLQEDLDFDANMVVGAEKNGSTGFHGIISILRINFKEQALMQSPYWLGPGTPDKQIQVLQYNDSGRDINYPDFRGYHYARLGFQHKQILQIMLTVFVHGSKGLILYNEGYNDGAYVALSLNYGALQLCFTCTGENVVCEEADLIQLERWHYVTLTVASTQAILRVNRGSAVQLSCLGRMYEPKEEMFLGGAPSYKWEMVKELTGVSQGYDGVVDVVVVNGRRFSFRRAGLFNFDGILNSMGYSHSAHVSEVVEHAVSKVTLRCDFTDFTKDGHHARAEWLIGDQLINSTEGLELIPLLPGLRNESSLTLLPEHQHEGLYSCVVNQDGALVITHTFPVYRVDRPLIARATTEWSIIIALVVFVVIIFITTVTILVVKRDTIQHMQKTTRYSPQREDSLEEAEVVDIDDLSIIQEEGEDSKEEEGEEYQIDDIPECSDFEEKEEQEEGEEDKQDDKRMQEGQANEKELGMLIVSEKSLDIASETELNRLGSAVAARLIEENKDKVLEIIASIGSLENLREISSRISQRLSAGSVSQMRSALSESAGQLRDSSSGYAGQMGGVSSSAVTSRTSAPSLHRSVLRDNVNFSAVRSSKTMVRNSSPSRIVRSRNTIQNMDSESTPSISPPAEVRRPTSRHSSVSPSRRTSQQLTGRSISSVSDLDTSPPSASVDIRRSSISRRSPGSPSPSRTASVPQPGSPRKLSMSISPTLGLEIDPPLLTEPPLSVQNYHQPDHSNQVQQQSSTFNLPVQHNMHESPSRPVYPVRPEISSYSGMLSGLPPTRRPLGFLNLSEREINEKLYTTKSVDVSDIPYVSESHNVSPRSPIGPLQQSSDSPQTPSGLPQTPSGSIHPLSRSPPLFSGSSIHPIGPPKTPHASPRTPREPLHTSSERPLLSNVQAQPSPLSEQIYPQNSSPRPPSGPPPPLSEQSQPQRESPGLPPPPSPLAFTEQNQPLSNSSRRPSGTTQLPSWPSLPVLPPPPRGSHTPPSPPTLPSPPPF